jgi:hypothetical protein
MIVMARIHPRGRWRGLEWAVERSRLTPATVPSKGISLDTIKNIPHIICSRLLLGRLP